MKKLILQVWAVLAALAFQGGAAPVAVPVAAVAAVAVADIVAPPPAFATEANPDPGFNNPSLHMPMGATPQPTVSGGKLHFTSAASSMTMDMITAPLVKTYHKFRVQLNLSNYVSGNFQVVLAKPMMGTANGTNIAAVDIHGLAPIASNFDRTLGLDTGTIPAAPGTLTDDTESAFRIMWSAGPITPNDPEVYNGQQGVSHLHQFLCNTWLPYHPEANYALSRSHGSTTCGNILDPRYPENRSSYWFPSLIDVQDGYAVLPHGNLYYKRYWLGSRHCFTDSMAGSCAEIPHGLRMITCYDFANGTFDGCPMSWTGGTYVGPDLQTAIDRAYSYAGDINAPILFSMQWPACWDGIHVDTPNHRSHMAFPQGDNSCPETHPYRLATISLQIFWNINADALAGHWHLSSDEMVSGWTSAKGSTGHMDYFEAWDPTTIHIMHTDCEDVGISSADGALCDGTAIKDGDKLTQSGGASVPSLDTFRPTLTTVPLGTTGYSKGCHANGVCTDEVTAGADGVIMVVCSDGCVGDVDDVTVTPIASGAHGPVTVHN